MRWILRWGCVFDEQEETFDDLAKAIERAQAFTEEDQIERACLFLSKGEDDHGEHVATYYPPVKGYWA